MFCSDQYREGTSRDSPTRPQCLYTLELNKNSVSREIKRLELELVNCAASFRKKRASAKVAETTGPASLEESLRAMSDLPIASMTARQLAVQLQGGSPPQLVDCRELQEWNYCRIAGAQHIPLGQIPMRSGELDENRPIVVYCHHGIRSLSACEFLLPTEGSRRWRV